MNLQKGQVITFIEEMSKQFVAGSKWMVEMESNGLGVNAILIKLKKNGTKTSEMNIKNFAPLSEASALELTKQNWITVN